MNTEDILKDLWRDYILYYWSNDNLIKTQIRLGSSSEANLIFTYDAVSGTSTIERTVFRDLQEIVTLSSLTFSSVMVETRVIKDLIFLISSKLTDEEMKKRMIVSYENLVFSSTKFINDNFDY